MQTMNDVSEGALWLFYQQWAIIGHCLDGFALSFEYYFDFRVIRDRHNVQY